MNFTHSIILNLNEQIIHRSTKEFKNFLKTQIHQNNNKRKAGNKKVFHKTKTFIYKCFMTNKQDT